MRGGRGAHAGRRQHAELGHRDGAAQSSSPRPQNAVKDPREQAWWSLVCEMKEHNGGVDEKRCSKHDTLFLCFSFEGRALMCMLRYSSGAGQQCTAPTSNSCNKWPGVSSVIMKAFRSCSKHAVHCRSALCWAGTAQRPVASDGTSL